MDVNSIRYSVTELAKSRNKVNRIAKEIEAEQKEIEQTQEYAELQRLLQQIEIAKQNVALTYPGLQVSILESQLQEEKEKVNTVEESLREQLEAHYRETKQKTVFPGIGVRVTTEKKVINPQEAVKWATANAPILLTVDIAKVKKMDVEIDGVETVEKVVTVLAKDLSEYLGEENE